MPTRKMITLRDETWLFQYRVGAIVIRNDKVLLCRDNVNGYWYMPGGRVELGESSETAIVREMREELNSVVKVGRLVWIIECFYGASGDETHEICLYYLVALDKNVNPPATEEFTIEEPDGEKNTFRWWQIEELPHARVYPSFLRTALRTLPATVQHIITRDSDG